MNNVIKNFGSYPEGIPFDEEEFERNEEAYKEKYITMGILCINGECVIRRCWCKWCHVPNKPNYPSRECRCIRKGIK